MACVVLRTLVYSFGTGSASDDSDDDDVEEEEVDAGAEGTDVSAHAGGSTTPPADDTGAGVNGTAGDMDRGNGGSGEDECCEKPLPLPGRPVAPEGRSWSIAGMGKGEGGCGEGWGVISIASLPPGVAAMACPPRMACPAACAATTAPPAAAPVLVLPLPTCM